MSMSCIKHTTYLPSLGPTFDKDRITQEKEMSSHDEKCREKDDIFRCPVDFIHMYTRHD
jgi:hypothetical protein